MVVCRSWSGAGVYPILCRFVWCFPFQLVRVTLLSRGGRARCTVACNVCAVARLLLLLGSMSAFLLCLPASVPPPSPFDKPAFSSLLVFRLFCFLFVLVLFLFSSNACVFFQVLTNSGAVPPLVVLLDSPNEEV